MENTQSGIILAMMQMENQKEKDNETSNNLSAANRPCKAER